MSDGPPSSPPSAAELCRQAGELPQNEREAFLGQACQCNAALRAEVEALLKTHLHDSFLESVAHRTTTDVLPIAMFEESGSVIGRYKLLEKVGEGGFGAVWMAEQREPVKRRVALKILKLGMDTKQVVARFEAERQALAMMDHANIAKVLDAGATETGRPYFAMELVRGIPITKYCDQEKLSPEERLRLFMKVCQAIQHAHQKGIIHRDIKPSNILVTLHDGTPVPKVIDFGIAKATQGDLTDKTVFTQFQQFIGTPAYMSPEQAEMSGLDIDTRADVYSLGVLLYELLTGRTPFDGKALVASGLDEMRRTIREVEPARPSTRLATLEEQERTTTAQRRGMDGARLVGHLKGDLDWIAMKCLEKDRTRRYETANGLAADIERYLTDEPVLARPPNQWYRVQKTIRRNRKLVVGSSILAVGLIASTIFSYTALIRERRARAGQLAAEQARHKEMVRAGVVADFIDSFFDETIGHLARQGQGKAVRQLIDGASKLVPTVLSNSPASQLRVHCRIASVAMGDMDDRARMASEAEEMARLLPLVADSDLPDTRQDMEIQIAAARLYGPNPPRALAELQALINRYERDPAVPRRIVASALESEVYWRMLKAETRVPIELCRRGLALLSDRSAVDQDLQLTSDLMFCLMGEGEFDEVVEVGRSHIRTGPRPLSELGGPYHDLLINYRKALCLAGRAREAIDVTASYVSMLASAGASPGTLLAVDRMRTWFELVSEGPKAALPSLISISTNEWSAASDLAGAAVAAAAAGESGVYERLRQRAIVRFGESAQDNRALTFLSMALAMPGDESVLSTAQDVLQRLQGSATWARDYVVAAKGRQAYRAGRFQEAAELFDQDERLPHDGPQTAEVARFGFFITGSRLMHAMACAQLNKASESLAWFKKAAADLDRRPSREFVKSPVGHPLDWCVALALRHEAEQLLAQKGIRWDR